MALPAPALLCSRAPGCPAPQSSSQCLYRDPKVHPQPSSARDSGVPPALGGDGFPPSRRPRGSPLPDSRCPRCSDSPRSPRGSSGPPLSQVGAGGAAPPRGAVGFSNTNTAPQPRPFPWSRPPRSKVPPSRAPPRLLPVPLASAQVPEKMPNVDCRLQGTTCGVQPRSPSVNPRSIWITRLSQANPAPRLVRHLD